MRVFNTKVFAALLLALALLTAGLLTGQTEPKFKTETLSVFRLFWDSPDAETVNAAAAAEHHSQIRDAQEAGFTSIGTSTIWVFPPFAAAPQVPETKINLFTDAPEARLHCLPPFGTAEYERLIGIRNSMWSTLAREFPETKLWIVGYDPSLLFYDCSGQQLDLQSLLVFSVDTLEGAKEAIKSQNPGATVVAHFLGRSNTPIFVREQLVQPTEIVEGILLEIARRGGVQTDYFDLWAFALDPELTMDRYSEPSIPVSFGSGGTASLASGWNTKYLEEFTVNTSNLVTTYADWEEFRTTLFRVPVAVSSGVAQVRLSAFTLSSGGAITAENSPDVVPDQEFTTQYPERNKWTAVMDFKPVINVYTAGVHSAVFIRVLDRTWATIDQTRFGSFSYGGLMTTGDGVCQNQPCGALQLSGDDVTANPPQSAGKQVLFHFTLCQQGCELPWDYPSHLYRVQIHEREYWDTLDSRYELQWQAEVWDVTDVQLIGQSNWIWESTVLNTYGIAIPALATSKLGFALGPGWAGGIDAALTGTAWWVY